MVLMSSKTPPIRVAAFDNSLTRQVGTRLADRLARHARRFVHLTAGLSDEGSHLSVAKATDCTLAVARPEAAATDVVNSCERLAVADSMRADASSGQRARTRS
jgi:hypothetical protein